MAKIKKILKEFTPPIIITALERYKTQKMWSGNYATWTDAQSHCTGYDAKIIIDKCRNSLLKVKNGEAAYERDSVLFDEIEYSYPLLSALMWIAAQNNGKLNLIDFGGSLGSTYFQNRIFLKDLKEVNWNIIEQKHFVEIGKNEFETAEIKFYYSIEECLKTQKSNAILLSSVIQYLEYPYEFIKKVLEFDFEFIIIDRTAFVFEGNDILTVQKVPSKIYNASYPAWIFNKQVFLGILLQKYHLITEFNTHQDYIIYTGRNSANYKGFILRKINHENINSNIRAFSS